MGIRCLSIGCHACSSLWGERAAGLSSALLRPMGREAQVGVPAPVRLYAIGPGLGREQSKYNAFRSVFHYRGAKVRNFKNRMRVPLKARVPLNPRRRFTAGRFPFANQEIECVRPYSTNTTLYSSKIGGRAPPRKFCPWAAHTVLEGCA